MSGLMSSTVYGVATLAFAAACIPTARRASSWRAEHASVLFALVASAGWCICSATLGSPDRLTFFFETVRNLAWLVTGYRMFANDGRHETLRQVRPLAGALMLVETMQIVLLSWDGRAGVIEISALLHMLVSIGALVLVHNLFGGAAPVARGLLAWTCTGLAAFWVFELNYYTIAYLTRNQPNDLEMLRGVVALVLAGTMAVGASRRAGDLTLKPSRALTFNTLSLVIVAVYLLAMIALSNGVARFAGDLAQVTQVGFIAAAAALCLLWLPSSRVQETVKRVALQHLFRHRYDYRAEWLRFTRTIASPSASAIGLHERAVQSLADIADSPCGILLMPAEDGAFQLASQWRWPTIELPENPISNGFARTIERAGCILDLDSERGKKSSTTFAKEALPVWLHEEPRTWALIPLLHDQRLIGIVVLARPQTARKLDWEDHDLLGIAGQQVASYLAEHASQEALQDASRFEEFNRRMAFVMHDIKNLSSQLGLLARNAEKHAENPEFRKDMLVTLRNSADKLDSLVSRLGRYHAGRPEQADPLDLSILAQDIVRRFSATHRVEYRGEKSVVVMGHSDALEQALCHLIQNAVEASSNASAVTVEVHNNGLRGEVAVVDTGVGMSADFVRTGLFRPFVSTKGDGFGIGACEARELVTAMGGRLHVESREGLGSRFSVSLPLAAAVKLRSRQQQVRDDMLQEDAA